MQVTPNVQVFAIQDGQTDSHYILLIWIQKYMYKKKGQPYLHTQLKFLPHKMVKLTVTTYYSLALKEKEKGKRQALPTCTALLMTSLTTQSTSVFLHSTLSFLTSRAELGFSL